MTQKLSDREKTCLGWAALGKSSWDIGSILGLSAHTVNFHLKNAMKKLGATSRMVACFRAVKLGLIDSPSEVLQDNVPVSPVEAVALPPSRLP